LTAGTYFLRYDLEYDLNPTNDSGTLAGFAFTDATGEKVAGVALQYDVAAASVPTNLTVTELADLGTNFIGKVSFIAKVDMGTKKMAVWYDLTGTGSFSAEGSPQTNNIDVTLLSIDNLHLQTTGDFRPAGSTNSAKVGLLRMSDSFADAAAADRTVPPAKYSNEWTFERDASGRPLSDTINSGTNSPLAKFAAGFGTSVFTTNRSLRCIGEDAGADGVWTNGAFLDAALTSTTSGVHYLRYDIAYDLSSSSNNSGTVLGVYFTGETGDKAAGVVMGYDKGNLTNGIPPGRSLVVIPGATDLTNNGTLTAIAEVDLDTKTLKVWYGLNGSNPTDYASPSFTTNITLTSITNLRFQATGDFRPAGSTDYADVDNIRHIASTSAGGVAWSNITESVANLALPPVLNLLVTDSLSGSMEIGETNTVTVVISNTGGSPASSASSTLNGASSFSVTSNNTAVTLEAGTSITNTYVMIANANGSYDLTIQAISTETNSAATNLSIVVGSQISYLTNSIASVSGGTVPGNYVPGETINITVVSTNDGAKTVTNIINTLSANPAYFTITPASAIYPTMDVGRSASTTYTVVISNATPAGIYTFSVTNQAGSQSWAGSFTLPVFVGAKPSVTNALLIEVSAGETATKQLILNNSGNAGTSFSLSDDGSWPLSYLVTTNNAVAMESFAWFGELPDTNAMFTDWTDTGSSPMNFGFNFRLYETVYTNFSVSTYGAIVLTNTVLGANAAGILPLGTASVIAPFWTGTAVNTNSVRFRQYTNDHLVVSWGFNTGSEFQAMLYTNGNIRYLYQAVPRTSVAAVGVQDAESSLNAENYIADSSSRANILLTPKRNSWVTYSPISGMVPGLGGSTVTFTANAAGQTAGTTTFNVLVTWGDGTTSTVAVTVRVIQSTPGLTANPSPADFSGPAGFITRTNVFLVNTGNVALAYTITDSGARTNGYNWAANNFQWQTVIPVDANVLTWTAGTNGNFSQAVPIGFPFPFFGTLYTQLAIGVNGWLTFGESRFIAPYWGDLSLDGNASIAYAGNGNQMVVTWANMSQTGGGSDQTFQAILSRDGSIRFQYNNLSGSNVWPYTTIGLQDDTTQTSATLSNVTTTVSNTVYTYSNKVTVVTNSPFAEINPGLVITNTQQIVTGTNYVPVYKNDISSQAILFVPAKRIVITASPLSGTIAAGETNTVTLTGDARSLTLGGTNAVTNSTVFNISYTGGSTLLPATFIATNSVQTAYSAQMAAWLAGTDLFVTDISQSANGSRTITWPAASDRLSRTYKVWYTLDLMQSFQWLATVQNGTGYVDAVHTNEPAVFYKVTVE
ncbi:MAG: hypothetical protein WC701_10800, partial [Kiritimatiellales bacterium]|jgi:hypothetical protein